MWTGSIDYGAAATPHDLQPLLDATAWPKLRHLGIINCEVVNDLLGALSKSKVLPQLRVLDLSKGVLRDEDIDLLLLMRGKLAHLERLDLSQNLLEERTHELKTALPNTNVADQRAEEEILGRYVAVGE